MNYTQNEKICQVTEKTLVVGIDIGSETHYARAFDWRGLEYTKKKAFKFSNSAEGFAEFMNWTRELMRLYDKDKMLPGMEPTGHYWINLCKYLQDCGIKPALVSECEDFEEDEEMGMEMSM